MIIDGYLNLARQTQSARYDAVVTASSARYCDCFKIEDGEWQNLRKQKKMRKRNLKKR